MANHHGDQLHRGDVDTRSSTEPNDMPRTFLGDCEDELVFVLDNDSELEAGVEPCIEVVAIFGKRPLCIRKKIE